MANSIKELKDIISKVPIKRVELSENENLNDVFQKHGSIGVMNLIQNAENELEEVEPIAQINVVVQAPLNLPERGTLQDDDNWQNKTKEFLNTENSISTNTEANTEAPLSEGLGRLEVIHENKLRLKTEFNHYYVLGALSQDLSAMNVTLLIEDLYYGKKNA